MTPYRIVLRDYGCDVEYFEKNLIGMLCKVIGKDGRVVGWRFYHVVCKEKRFTPPSFTNRDMPHSPGRAH